MSSLADSARSSDVLPVSSYLTIGPSPDPCGELTPDNFGIGSDGAAVGVAMAIAFPVIDAHPFGQRAVTTVRSSRRLVAVVGLAFNYLMSSIVASIGFCAD